MDVVEDIMPRIAATLVNGVVSGSGYLHQHD
jgi:hypothetical protein